MSVITGLWFKDGRKVDPVALSALGEQSKRYAPDGTTTAAKDSLWMMSQALQTHERSNLGTGPASDSSGNLILLDGRIDNYEDLCSRLDLNHQTTSDASIALAAYRRWGTDSFGHLVGDWAVVLWDETAQALYLGRDHAGTRTLYYADDPRITMWSTFPEPILAHTGAQELDHQYVECYLAVAPTGDHTPYAGIRAVPSACYLTIRRTGEIRCEEHWSPLVREKLHYVRDEDYQEEFLSLFCQAVKRRIDGTGVFAHLSGGVDSSSIVCVADRVATSEGKTPSLRTISFFDDEEPDWDERPFFTAIEEQRGIRGTHIQTSSARRDFVAPSVFYPYPGADNATYEREKFIAQLPELSDCRVILAGHGGDELLGGPPDPRPELADALLSMSLRRFFHSSFDWALHKRTTLLEVASDAVKFTIRCYPRIPGSQSVSPPWLVKKKTSTESLTLANISAGTMGFAPSAAGMAGDWQRLLETLPHRHHGHEARYEYRYPYLDRDLVDFLLRVPPSQLVRPGRRRFMMRAAIQGIVPSLVLERRRKAFVSRGPAVALQENTSRLAELLQHSSLDQMGLVNSCKAIDLLKQPIEIPGGFTAPLLRLIGAEIWTGQALRKGVIEHAVALSA